MQNGRSHICGFLRHLHVKNGRTRRKTFEPIFYRRHMNETYVKRKRNEVDAFFDALNLYHPHVKFTQE